MQESDVQNPDEVHVKLKPFLGVPPTTYLPLFYAAALLIILFLLLMLPGLVKAGSVLTVTSSPPGAAVRVDGVIQGKAGDDIFVARGAREIAVTLPGHVAFEESVDVGRRLVGSLFFPRRIELSVSLDTVDAANLVDKAAQEFSQWALLGEASGQYQFPPVARTLGSDLAAAGVPGLYDDFMVAALPQLDSEAQSADLLAGALLAASGGNAPSSFAIAGVLQKVALLAESNPGLPAHLGTILSARHREMVTGSAWAESAGAQFGASVAGPEFAAATRPGATTSIAGISFVNVAGGSGVIAGTSRAERGGNVPYEVSVPRMLVSQTEVTVGDYARFTAAVPRWAYANRAQLIADGVADGEYLRTWADGMPSATLPVRNVSAYAAQAFADWLSTQSGADVRLPTEAEWDYIAARDAPQGGVFATARSEGPDVVGESGRGNLGLYGIAGNVWEWTADSFATYARYYPRLDWVGGQRVVRGGGWATPEPDFTLGDRGSLPPDWCSGAVGFRLVVTE